MPGEGRRFVPKLSHERELSLAIEIVEKMSAENISAHKAIQAVRHSYGVSHAYCYTVLNRNGFPLSRLTPDALYRRAVLAAATAKLYSLPDKQGIVNRLIALAKLEVGQLEAAYLEDGEFTDSFSRRLSRAVTTMNRAIDIDSKLNKAGIPVDGWVVPHTPEGGESESEPKGMHDLLAEARARRDALRAEQERLTS